MRVLPAPALVAQREINDEARSDRHRKRGHFGRDRWVETADAQSYRRYGPARAYSSQAYTPQSRGAVRRGGVPGNAPGYSNSDSPAATGGGSLGYNQNLWNW